MANYKNLTLRFSADTSGLDNALEQISSKAEKTQKSLEYIGGRAQLGYGLIKSGTALKSLGDGMARIGDKLSIVSAAMLVTFGRKMISDVEQFGNAIAQVGGYLEITGDRLSSMRELALYFGKETQYSATEAAQAMGELAKGGLTDAEIAAGALDATMQLAAAGQMGFAEAAKTSVQAIKAFGMEAGDSVAVADALAGAATKSVATVEGLATGFSYAAGWARQAGWSINDVSGALALLSDYGIDAEMGGTALRNVLLRLAAPTQKAADLMEEYGIEVRDADGHMKSATEIVDALNLSLAGLADNERDQIVSTLFGTRGANAALALMDAGSESLRTYIGYTQDAGAAAKMAKAQMGELGWALEYLRGEAETAAVNFGSSLEPVLVEAAQAAEELLKWFNALSDSEREHVVNMTLMAIGTGPFLSVTGRVVSVLGSVTKGLGSTILGVSAFVRATRGGKDAMTALAGALQVTQFISAEKAAGKAAAAVEGLKAGLAGLAIVLAGFVIYTIVDEYFMKLQREAERVQERLDLVAEASDAVSDSMRETVPTVGKASDAYRTAGYAAGEAAESVDRLLQAHIDLADSIDARNKAAQETIDVLTTAKGFIDEYAGSEHLAADEVAKLQWALGIVNQETGRNYELMYANSGVIGENGEAVDNLTDSLNDLIDARIREAQMAAASSALTELYKERYERERQRNDIEADIARRKVELEQIRRDMDNLEPYENHEWELMYASMDIKAKELEAEISDLQISYDGFTGVLDDNARAIEFYTDVMADLQPQLETMEDKLRELLHVAGQDVFGQLGGRAEEFITRLEDAGVSAESFSTLTQAQFSALVTALNADGYMMEDMLALVTGNIELASTSWQESIREWAEANGVTTEEAMEAIRQGIADGEVDVSNGLVSVFESSIGLAREYARAHAAEPAQEAASRIEGVFESTARNASQWAVHLMENYISGIDSNIPKLERAAQRAADQGIALRMAQTVAKKGSLHYTDVWGVHLMENYISGIESKIPKLERTARRVADTLAWGINDQSLYMSAGNGAQGGVVINIDGMRINDDPAIRQAFIDIAYDLEERRRGYGG